MAELTQGFKENFGPASDSLASQYVDALNGGRRRLNDVATTTTTAPGTTTTAPGTTTTAPGTTTAPDTTATPGTTTAPDTTATPDTATTVAPETTTPSSAKKKVP